MDVFLNRVWLIKIFVWVATADQSTALQQKAPVAMIGSVYQEVYNGNPVTLTCSVASDTQIRKVYWQKVVKTNNRTINSETAGISGITVFNPSMNILKVTTYDSGKYRCAAENSYGTGYSPSINLTVIGGLPVVSIGSERYTTVYGQKISLACSIKAYPAATGVYWIKVTNNNVTILNNGAVGTTGITLGAPSLEIPFPSFNDSGEYTCIATNDVGTSSSGKTVLIVTGEIPTVTVGLKTYDTEYGSSVVLSCSVAAIPLHFNVYWEKEVFGETTRITSYTSGITGITTDNPSMTIKFATTSDTGIYTCFASNYIGTGSSKSTALRVNGGLPVVSIGSERYTTVYGQKITLACSIKASPVATGVYWMKETNSNVIVLNNGAVGTTGITIRAPSLEIPFPSFKDSGLYTCIATNVVGTSSSGKTILTVTGEIPTVTVGLRTYETEYGSSVVLSCSVAATPLHFNVYWEKEVFGETTRITSYTSGITGITTDNPSVTIKFATTSDTGIYTCFASNYIGTGSSKSTALRVNGGLPKVSADRGSYTTRQGETVSLGCSVTAQPPLRNVYWEKKVGDQTTIINQGGIGVLGVSLSLPTLTIQTAVIEDTGMYVCHGTNVVGSSKSEIIHLTVYPPSNDIYNEDVSENVKTIGIPVIIVGGFLGALIGLIVKCMKSRERNCFYCKHSCNCCNRASIYSSN